MKPLYPVAFALVGSVLAASGRADAEDTLHEDGTWGERDAPTRRALPIVEVSQTPDQAEDGIRVRAGVGPSGGAYLVGEDTLGLFGIEGRLGIQMNDLFGLYAAASSWLGGQGDLDVLGRVGLALMAELTLADMFFVGAGPEFFAIGAHDPLFETETHVGVRGRAGVAFGSKRPGRRHAFTISFDARLDLYEETLGFAPTLGLGYDAF